MRSFKLALLFLLIPSVCFAWCENYVVKKGDTYKSISKHYFDDPYYAPFLSSYNKSRPLVPGEKIPFFIPKSEYDWKTGCRNLIVSRMTQKKAHKMLEDFSLGIPSGLEGVAILSGQESLDPILAFDLCIISLAVAEVSTNYGMLPTAKGRLSVYNLQPKVPMSILKYYDLWKILEENGLTLKEAMDHVSDATMVFVIYFSTLFVENKSLGKALLAYFSEKDFKFIALNAYTTYLDILQITPYPCKLEDRSE